MSHRRLSVRQLKRLAKTEVNRIFSNIYQESQPLFSTSNTHAINTQNDDGDQINAASNTPHIATRDAQFDAFQANDENMFQMYSTSDSESDSTYDLQDHDISDDDYDTDISDDSHPYLLQLLQKRAITSNIPLVHINAILIILRHFFPNLPKDARTLVDTPKEYKIMDVPGGHYHHFGLAHGILERLDMHPKYVQDNACIEVKVNIDGLPIFKSTIEQFWPMLGQLENEAQVFPIGVFVGQSKPQDLASYLSDFITETQSLKANGISYRNEVYAVNISKFTCDAPAQAFKKKQRHTTVTSIRCDKCCKEGAYPRDKHKVIFPTEVTSAPRTDDKYRLRVAVSGNESNVNDHDDHYRGKSPLSDLGLGMTSQFPLDPMHLVFLGVSKKIIQMWLPGPGPLHAKQGTAQIRTLSNSLVKFNEYLPQEFARKCRPLTHLERWKATEFRTFLMYTGVVALLGKFPEIIYRNFMMLHVAITIFSNNLCQGLPYQLCGSLQCIVWTTNPDLQLPRPDPFSRRCGAFRKFKRVFCISVRKLFACD